MCFAPRTLLSGDGYKTCLESRIKNPISFMSWVYRHGGGAGKLRRVHEHVVDERAELNGGPLRPPAGRAHILVGNEGEMWELWGHI